MSYYSSHSLIKQPGCKKPFAFEEVADSFRLKNKKDEGISPLTWYANQKGGFINKQKLTLER
jgi:hypothetical protein